MDKFKVGFIGLGLMGNPMAKNIFKKGFPLTVYNRSPERLSDFKKLGVPVAKSPKDLAKYVDVIITMVTGPKDVREVLLGKNGVAQSAKKGQVVIDMSTIGKVAAQEIYEDLKTFGIKFLDAPVTGSVNKATDGTLTIFIGGDKRTYEAAEPVLSAMGENLQYVGPAGSGQAVKLINNLLIANCLVGLAEGMILANKMGLPRQKVAEALDQAMVMSPAMRMKMPNMVKGQFPVSFSMANMDKDLKLALKEIDGKLPVLKLVEKFYGKGVKEGLKNEDNSAIVAMIEKSVQKK